MTTTHIKRLVLAAVALAISLMVPASADAKFVFPYNHPDIKWYTIETEHFFVHYPVSKKETSKTTKYQLNLVDTANQYHFHNVFLLLIFVQKG